MRRTGLRRNRRRRLLRRLRYRARTRAPAASQPSRPRRRRWPRQSTARIARDRPAPDRPRPAALAAASAPGVVAMPPIPKGDPVAAILTDPQVPEGQPVLRQLRMQQARRTRPRRTTRAHRGLLHPVRHAILVCSQAFSRRPRRRAVRSAGMHRARRPRLDLPGDRPQRAQPLGGAQGSGELRRRRRDGRRRRRSPRPRRGGTPEHRPDPQLRRAQRTRPACPSATSSWSTSAARR